MSAPPALLPELVEEGVIDGEDLFGLHAQAFLLEQLDDTLAVDQLDWNHALAAGFGFSSPASCWR